MLASIYLILIIHGQALWGLPQPYPSQAACDEAGAAWDSGGPPEPGTRGHYCLPAAIVPVPPRTCTISSDNKFCFTNPATATGTAK